MSLTLSFRCLANLLINSSAGTSKTVGNSGDVLSGSGFSSGRRGRRNIRLHRRVREFAGFLYGYLRIAPQRRHEMMILELAGRSLIRAFFPGTKGWPQFLQR